MAKLSQKIKPSLSGRVLNPARQIVYPAACGGVLKTARLCFLRSLGNRNELRSFLFHSLRLKIKNLFQKKNHEENRNHPQPPEKSKQNQEEVKKRLRSLGYFDD